jgi:hypothetical protein
MKGLRKIKLKKIIRPDKSKSLEQYNIFAFGQLDLIFIIDFTPQDLIQMVDGNKVEVKLDDNTELPDLSFIENNDDLISRIKLNSNNESLSQFILMNQASKKTYKKVEYFCYHYPRFEGNTFFFKKIFDSVTRRYGIYFNKISLDKNQPFSIKINITSQNYSGIKDFYEDKDKESDMSILSEPNVNAPQQTQQGIDSDIDEEDNKAIKLGLIPRFKRKKTMLRKLYPSYHRYDLMFINYNEIKNIKGDFEDDDLLELIEFFKKKKKKENFCKFLSTSKK